MAQKKKHYPQYNLKLNMMASANIMDGMVQQNTTRPHFTYADRVIKYLLHQELIPTEVTKLSIAEQCLLTRDFMHRHDPEPYVRAEQFPREIPLPAQILFNKIKHHEAMEKSPSSTFAPSSSSIPPLVTSNPTTPTSTRRQTNLNMLATPLSPPTSPLIYPSSPLSSPDPILNKDDLDKPSPKQTISAANAQTKLPKSCIKYMEQRKNKHHYIHCAAQVVVRCGLKLQDLETYIPHANLKKLIKFIITISMNPPHTVPKKTKHVLKIKSWKPYFQRWVINALIDSGSSDVLGHSAKHITNIQRGADTIINVMTYYMRLTTNIKRKRKDKEKKIGEEKDDQFTKPAFTSMDNGKGLQMFTLKGESSEEDVDGGGDVKKEIEISGGGDVGGDIEDKKKKERMSKDKYYEKWGKIFGEDVRDLSAYNIQRRCVEKYEICCDIARYFFINDNWRKSKKWFNRANRWYLRVDHQNENIDFKDMISHKRYEWNKIVNIIKVLNVILRCNDQSKLNQDTERNNLHNQIYYCCQRIIDGTLQNESLLQMENKLCQLLVNICKKQQLLKILSMNILKVWLNEMEYFCKQRESVTYLKGFLMVFQIFNACCSDNDNEWNINDSFCDDQRCDFIAKDKKYMEFYVKLMDQVYHSLSGKQQNKFYIMIIQNVNLYLSNLRLKFGECLEEINTFFAILSSFDILFCFSLYFSARI